MLVLVLKPARLLRIVIGIRVVQAEAGAQHDLVVDLVCHADARPKLYFGIGSELSHAADTREREAALQVLQVGDLAWRVTPAICERR